MLGVGIRSILKTACHQKDAFFRGPTIPSLSPPYTVWLIRRFGVDRTVAGRAAMGRHIGLSVAPAGGKSGLRRTW